MQRKFNALVFAPSLNLMYLCYSAVLLTNIIGSENFKDDIVRIMTNRRENVFSYSVSMAVGLIFRVFLSLLPSTKLEYGLSLILMKKLRSCKIQWLAQHLIFCSFTSSFLPSFLQRILQRMSVR